jgi:dTDP-D-glucose 4,6-dehydratase
VKSDLLQRLDKSDALLSPPLLAFYFSFTLDLITVFPMPQWLNNPINGDDGVKKALITGITGQDGSYLAEFLYVEDAAEGMLFATEKYNKPEPVNIGAGFEIRIKDLVDLIVKLTGFKGKVAWDTSKPDGQLRRMSDTSRADKEFGFKAKMDFEEGLKNSIKWYREKQGQIATETQSGVKDS